MHRLTEITLDNPKTAAAILLLVTLVLAAGALRVQVAHGARVLVGEDHPAMQTLDEVVANFSGGLPIEIGWACGEGLPCSNALDADSLAVAAELTAKLEAMPGVRKVRSPSNSALLTATDEGLEIRRFVENGQLREDFESLVPLVLADDLWVGRLVSRDLKMAAVIVQLVDNRMDTGEAILDRIEPAFSEYEARGYEFRLNGWAVRGTVGGQALQASTATIIPALVVVIAAVLYAFGGSLAQVILALATMGIAVLWTRGVMGWLAWPQDGIHQILTPLVFVVGVCDAVHLLSRAAEIKGSARERILGAAADVALPCFITTATTALALASFVTSDLFSFVRFGTLAAVGVFACFLLTFTLLPLLAISIPGFGEAPDKRASMWEETLQHIVGFSADRSRTVLAAGLALLLFGAVGWAAHLRVDTDAIRAWGEDSDVSQWVAFFNETRGSSDSVEIQLELPSTTGSSFESPEALAVVDTLSSELEALPDLQQASSIVDLIDRVGTVMLPGAGPEFRYASTRGGNAELLELISFSDPESLAPWLTLDRSTARISIGGTYQSQRETHDLMASVEAIAARVLPPDWQVTFTGAIAARDTWIPDIQATQLRSFPTAFLLVFVLASFFLKSPRLGLIAMIPTFVPIVVTLGAMGWMGLGLDIGRAMVAAVVIGIGVDDSVHFLDAYRRYRLEGADSRDAARGAIRHVGRALVTTSVALSLGFLTLMASAWQTISSFGFFVSLTIMAALVATLFLLPALLLGPWNRSAEDVPTAD